MVLTHATASTHLKAHNAGGTRAAVATAAASTVEAEADGSKTTAVMEPDRLRKTRGEKNSLEEGSNHGAREQRGGTSADRTG